MIVRREMADQILPWLGTEKIIIIKGSRQTGKTFLLHYLEDYLKEKGESTIFINVEQKRHLPMFHDPKLFYRFLKEQANLGNGKKLYVFLNHFEYLRLPGTFLKTLYEMTKEHLQIITSAATSFTVIKNEEELGELRKVFYLRRFSFREYLSVRSDLKYSDRFKFHQIEKMQDFYTLYKHDLEEYISDFIYWGAFPSVVMEKDPEKRYEILDNIIHHYIEKDISSFLRVENVDAFIQLMEILAHETGNLLNHQDLSTRLGIHKKTLGKYLEIVEGTFTYSFIPPYFTNPKKELAKMHKVYSNDAGLVSYFLRQAPHDLISVYPALSRVKNYIFNEIRKMGHNDNIYFYRTIAKAEIDFVLCTTDEIIPIKIKPGKKNQKVPVVLKNFKSTYSDYVKKMIVVTQDELRWEDNCLFIPYTLFPFLTL